MPTETYKLFRRKNGNATPYKIQVDSAKEDGNGLQIDTGYAGKIEISSSSGSSGTTYSIQLKTPSGNNVGNAATFNVAVDSTIVSGYYSNGNLYLELSTGDTVTIPVSDLVAGLASESDLEKVAQSIADVYSSANTYAVGNLVMYENKLYRCTTAISTGEAWNASHWQETNIETEIDILEGTLNAFSISINGTVISKVNNNVNIPLASSNNDGAMSSSDKIKLDGIASGAQVNVLEGVQVNSTDLSISNKKVNIPLVASNSDGAMSSSDKIKLDGIASGAQVNTIENIQLNGANLVPSVTKTVNVNNVPRWFDITDRNTTLTALSNLVGGANSAPFILGFDTVRVIYLCQINSDNQFFFMDSKARSFMVNLASFPNQTLYDTLASHLNCLALNFDTAIYSGSDKFVTGNAVYLSLTDLRTGVENGTIQAGKTSFSNAFNSANFNSNGNVYINNWDWWTNSNACEYMTINLNFSSATSVSFSGIIRKTLTQETIQGVSIYNGGQLEFMAYFNRNGGTVSCQLYVKTVKIPTGTSGVSIRDPNTWYDLSALEQNERILLENVWGFTGATISYKTIS